MKIGAQVAISLLFFHFHQFPAIFRVSLYLETEGHKGEFSLDNAMMMWISSMIQLNQGWHWISTGI